MVSDQMSLGESLFPLARNASNVDANQSTKCKEGNLFRCRRHYEQNQRIRKKPSKWAEITNCNLPKTKNVWIFENCFRVDIRNLNYSLHDYPWDMVQSQKEGAALNKGKWRQISWGDTQNNKTQPRKRGKPLKRPNRNHQYQRNDQNETAETSETTKTSKNTE